MFHFGYVIALTRSYTFGEAVDTTGHGWCREVMSGLFIDAPETGWLTETLISAWQRDGAWHVSLKAY